MIRQHLVSLTGFRRYAAAFGLGALMTLSTPPIGLFPVLLFCIPGFIYLTRTGTKKQAFLSGWAFGAGYFILGLYWISAALFVDIHQWFWVLPFSAIVGPGLFALYYGFIPLLAWGCRKNPVSFTLATVAAWAIIDWLRRHLFTGFPWNLTGYTWTYAPPVMQVSAYTGIYGLTLLTLLWAAVPALMENRKIAGMVGASFILAALLGTARMNLHPTALSVHTVRIVQANIPETEKWTRETIRRNFDRHMRLSQTSSSVDAVIWPETSVAADLQSTPDVAKLIAKKMPRSAYAILGALRITDNADETHNFYNSVSVLDSSGKVAATYDKHHLVPFGEYIPFRSKLNLTPIALAISNLGDFTKGGGPETLHAGKLPPFSPLICYEVVFPHEITPADDRPEWLVNVTNDGWYGLTAGPYQHFETARVRAIEEGLPLARAANTGISAMIDPLGRVLAEQPLGTEGAIEAPLPKPLPPTPYAKLGDVPFLLMFALLALFAARRRA